MKSIAHFNALLAFSLAAHADATVTEKVTQSFAVNSDVVISLENVNGDIDITAWDKAEVSLVADKRAKDDEGLHRLEISIDAEPAHLAIKTKHAKKSGFSFFGGWNDNSSVRYKLMVPAAAKLEKIDAVNSDITVSGVRGPVSLETVNGGIEATGLVGDAKLESVNGRLRAEFASLGRVDHVSMESVNGRVEVTLPKGAGATIKTSSVNGSSNIDQAIKLSKSGRHGISGDIGTGGPRITLETVNGSISVKEK